MRPQSLLEMHQKKQKKVLCDIPYFFLYDVEITAQELNKFCVFDVLIVIYQ